MRDGPRGFGQDSSCPALLRCPLRNYGVTHTGLSPSVVAVSTAFRFVVIASLEVLRPRGVRKRNGLGSAPFARHYSGYRCFLSLPPGTKMFQFPGFALTNVSSGSSNHWVPPFGYARITPCLQVPEPFRSLPRPSSPPDSLGIRRSLFVSFLICSAPLCFRTSHDTRRREANSESFLICSCLEIAVPIFSSSKKLLNSRLYRLSFCLSLPLDLFSQYCQ